MPRNCTLSCTTGTHAFHANVLDVQGVRRAEQNNLLDLFLARTSTATGLTDTSFLTSLDMDPQLTSLATSGLNSGAQSPSLGGPTSTSLFGAAMGANGSRDGLGLGLGSAGASRAGTPVGGVRDGGERGKEALVELRRFGARIGVATRLFGGRENSTG